MQINNGFSSVRFTANVSDKVMYQLTRQVVSAKNNQNRARLNKALTEQLRQVKRWGSSDSEIVITENRHGYYRLGLNMSIPGLYSYTCPFENLSARTELSQFLRLKSSHISKAEENLMQLIRKNRNNPLNCK